MSQVLPGLGAAAGLLSAIVESTFSGLFTTSAGTPTVTSPSRTYTLGAGNSGQVKFASVVNTGSGVFRYSKNGGANTTISDNDIITLASTDTLVLSATGLLSGEGVSCDLIDVDTGIFLEPTLLLSRT